MFNIVGTTITLTRGDSFKATVQMIDENGESYIPQEGDKIRFAVKRRYTDTKTIISKVIPNDTLLLELEPKDTEAFKFGSYVYDIQLTYANGEVDTFIDKATLVISEEVD